MHQLFILLHHEAVTHNDAPLIVILEGFIRRWGWGRGSRRGRGSIPLGLDAVGSVGDTRQQLVTEWVETNKPEKEEKKMLLSLCESFVLKFREAWPITIR
jgi:hypothetical protein